jgi:hypothetical protein
MRDVSDARRLAELAERLTAATTRALDGFRRLQRENEASTQVMRMHASFLIDVANEAQRGNRLIERADELDEIQVQCQRGRCRVRHVLSIVTTKSINRRHSLFSLP